MRKYLSIIALILLSISGFSCTTFVLKSGENLIFGRNLDWYSDNGIIVINQRNQKKKSLVFPPDKPIEWTSKYGSISFNQFGKEFPYGGINEKGLVIEIMVAEAQYPETDSRKAVNELQWIQYQLDNAASVDEVIANDKIIRLRKISQNLHFLVADGNGEIAVIEFINGKMKVYKNESLPVPVLENDTYKQSLENLKNNTKCRFTTTAKKVLEYDSLKNPSNIDYSFNILDSVALDGSWTIVYDVKKLEIHFKTASNQNIKTIKLADFDFNCYSKTFVYDLKIENSENIKEEFVVLNKDLNTLKMKDAMNKAKIKLPENIKQLFYNYYMTVNCE